MTFYMQHGYGKGNRLTTLGPPQHVSGVVLSPADEDALALPATAIAARGAGLDVLVDPQSYIYSARPSASAKHHPSHRIAFPAMDWSQSPSDTEAHLDAVRAMQSRINPDGTWIAPSVLQSGFADVWTPLSLQYARGAALTWPTERTLATIAIDESAFAVPGAMEDWLDIATTLSVRGFYLLVQRNNTQYPAVAWAPDRLANVLRLIYTLGDINRYRVHWGYSDSEGLLGLAVGASAISAGWSFGLRQFSTSKWIPSSGGRPSTIRVPMARLWSSIRALGEADDLYASTLRSDVFSADILARFPTGAFGNLSRSEAQDLYLLVIARAADRVSAIAGTSARLDYLSAELDSALDLFGRIESSSLTLEPRYRPRVAALREALRLFRSAESL
jgi:hypothetical protein